jgi:hypothetical protein
MSERPGPEPDPEQGPPRGPRSAHTPPRFRKPRPPIDDTEFVDDLRRQDEDFVRVRTAEYFGLYQRAAARLSQPGGYARGDLTTDAWTLWGMVTRDAVDMGFRFVRTMNQLAADTPVPTEPYRRASTKVRVSSTERPLHLRCSELVSVRVNDKGDSIGREVISPAEIEINPNPLLGKADWTPEEGPPRVKVTVNAAAPAGEYTGRLLVFGRHPDHPIEAVGVSLVVPTGFSRP